MNAADILGPEGPIARGAKQYECRAGQQQMAGLVEKALLRDEIALIEAGTGTGKTWAYLVPALLSGRKIIISTATKALQDQIVEHDLPEIKRYLGLSVDTVSIKGLSNYLCLRRWQEFAQSADALDERYATDLETIRAWLGRSGDGDRSTLMLPDDSLIWPRVMSTSETRVGARCDFYDRCFVTHVRRRVEEAQLVVTNHHFFCADLALRASHPAALLSEYEAVIFDEAHQLPEIATQFFGCSISQRGIERLVRDVKQFFQKRSTHDREGSRLADAVLRSGGQLFSSVPLSIESNRTALSEDFITSQLRESGLHMESALEALQKHLELMGSQAENADLQPMTRRLSELRDTMATLAQSNEPEHVTWADRTPQNVSLSSSPVEVGSALQEHLFSRVQAVVFTSATLATAGKFDFIRKRLGLQSEGIEQVVASPFDYEKQCALYLPSLSVTPRDPQYAQHAADEITKLVKLTRGGALLLFTSFRMLRLVRSLCAERWDYPTWVQGEAPNHALLERLRESENGVLFGTSSFWQGVDIPGQSLRLVVIDKLPFDVPSDPLIAARCKQIEAEGEKPFMSYLVPSAIMELKQGFGRLIRTQSDRGVVALLDPRIRQRHYGKLFLRSLPNAQRCETWPDLERFWMQHAAIDGNLKHHASAWFSSDSRRETRDPSNFEGYDRSSAVESA